MRGTTPVSSETSSGSTTCDDGLAQATIDCVARVSASTDFGATWPPHRAHIIIHGA
jgi:hypothetical protein